MDWSTDRTNVPCGDLDGLEHRQDTCAMWRFGWIGALTGHLYHVEIWMDWSTDRTPVSCGDPDGLEH